MPRVVRDVPALVVRQHSWATAVARGVPCAVSASGEDRAGDGVLHASGRPRYRPAPPRLPVSSRESRSRSWFAPSLARPASVMLNSPIAPRYLLVANPSRASSVAMRSSWLVRYLSQATITGALAILVGHVLRPLAAVWHGRHRVLYPTSPPSRHEHAPRRHYIPLQRSCRLPVQRRGAACASLRFIASSPSPSVCFRPPPVSALRDAGIVHPAVSALRSHWASPAIGLGMTPPSRSGSRRRLHGLLCDIPWSRSSDSAIAWPVSYSKHSHSKPSHSPCDLHDPSRQRRAGVPRATLRALPRGHRFVLRFVPNRAASSVVSFSLAALPLSPRPIDAACGDDESEAAGIEDVRPLAFEGVSGRHDSVPRLTSHDSLSAICWSLACAVPTRAARHVSALHETTSAPAAR